MKFRMLGLDHKSAPIEIREQFSFNKTEAAAFLQDWICEFPDCEAILLSTCNRTELYVGSQGEELPSSGAILRFLTRQKGEKGLETEKKTEAAASLSEDQFPSFILLREDTEAVYHLFSVAASLESMVVGEPQILAQMKEAYRIAEEAQTTGLISHTAFQAAFKTAKRVSTETEICRHKLSIPAIAIGEFALSLFEKLSGKTTLVLGAGEMAEETLRYVKDSGGKRILIANRSRDKAEKLAETFGGGVVDWGERFTALAQADLVIAATGATEPIVTLADYHQIAPRRQGRPLFMVDLSVPRNLDPQLAKKANLYLYSIDDLQDVCARNQKSRDQELPKAKKIVAQETERFVKELRFRDSGQLIRQIREEWNRVKESEIERLFHKCHHLDEKERQEVRYAFDRLVNKLLHPPMESLRDETESGRPDHLLKAMMKLFHLG